MVRILFFVNTSIIFAIKEGGHPGEALPKLT